MHPSGSPGQGGTGGSASASSGGAPPGGAGGGGGGAAGSSSVAGNTGADLPDAGDAAPASVEDAGGAPIADAPTFDGAGGDRSAEGPDASGGGSRCPHLFCEDFESGSLDRNVWSIETGGGPTIAIEDHIVSHGTHAMHLHIPGSPPPGAGGYAFIITKNAPTALRSHHFGRANIHATPRIPSGNQQLLIAGTGAVPALDHLFVAVRAVGWMRRLELKTVSEQAETWLNQSSVPDARWACFEWEMDASPGRISLFVDGKPLGAFNAAVGADPLSFGFDVFGFGFYGASPNTGPVADQPIDLYYDDIALDAERIGCL
jgi:hypothetical protein